MSPQRKSQDVTILRLLPKFASPNTTQSKKNSNSHISLDLPFSVSNNIPARLRLGYATEANMSGRHENSAARVRRRISEWVKEQGHGSRKRLADKVHGLYGKTRSASWVTDLIDGPDAGGQDLRLCDLDAVADVIGVPPGDLVRHNDNMYAEVTPSEMRVLRFHRALPDVTRHHLMGYFEYLYNLQQKMLEAQAHERDARTADAKRQRAIDERTRKRSPA